MGDQRVKSLGVAEDAPEKFAVENRMIPVSEIDGAGFPHEADLGHALTFAVAGGGASGIDIDQFDVASPAQDEVDHGRIINCWVRIRLDDD
jgi:hypothetical protein